MIHKEDVFPVLANIAKHLEPVSGARVAAAVTKGNVILGIGVGSYKTHPLMAKANRYINPDRIYLHAEASAIMDAKRRGEDVWLPSGCKLWVVRVTLHRSDSHKDKRWYPHYALANPCDGCKVVISRAGVASVVFSTLEDGWA